VYTIKLVITNQQTPKFTLKLPNYKVQVNQGQTFSLYPIQDYDPSNVISIYMYKGGLAPLDRKVLPLPSYLTLNVVDQSLGDCELTISPNQLEI
jgi:hypothetical protein